MKPFALFAIVVALVLFAIYASGCAAQQVTLSSKERIVFFGDSITELGVKPNGYVSLVRQDLKKQLKKIEIVGAGVSGNKVPDLLKRLEKDVLSKKPTVVVVYIGINDVWHYALKGLRGTSKDDFKDGLEELAARIEKAKIKLVLCTPTVIGEKHLGENPQDQMLQEYSEVIRKIAKEKKVTLCDLRKAFLDHLKENNRFNQEKGILTTDRVHLNLAGNTLVAQTVLKVFKTQLQ
jgi:lysophospholipase L1-like esterase